MPAHRKPLHPVAPFALAQDNLYTLADTARILGLSKTALWQRLHAAPDFIPKKRLGRLLIFTADDVIRLWQHYQ